MNLNNLKPAWRQFQLVNSMTSVDTAEILTLIERVEDASASKVHQYLVSAILFAVISICCQAGWFLSDWASRSPSLNQPRFSPSSTWQLNLFCLTSFRLHYGIELHSLGHQSRDCQYLGFLVEVLWRFFWRRAVVVPFYSEMDFQEWKDTVRKIG